MTKFLKKNWPLVCIALLLLTVGLFMVRSRKEMSKKPAAVETASSEGVKLADIHLTDEGADKDVRWTLDAKEVTISEDKQNVAFTSFSLRLEPSKGPVINLSGETGRYDRGAGVLHLGGALRGRTADGYAIATERAVYSHKEGRLVTEDPVHITGPFFSVEGEGLTYDIATETLEIRSKVNTLIRGEWSTS
ncbi:MAG: LPS export ABC transporter periplasmic protein LptC [Deltaproteobacteria bacterium]|nr:LPS export ABC transporter periplasmic protein LptC [Deltaproteobacteria bacterium]